MASSTEAKNNITLPQALTALVSWPFAIIFEGMILTLLWRWFVATPFHVMQLGIMHAIGLSLLLCAASPIPQGESKVRTERPFLYYISIAFLRPLFFLVLGAAVHHFM